MRQILFEKAFLACGNLAIWKICIIVVEDLVRTVDLLHKYFFLQELTFSSQFISKITYLPFISLLLVSRCPEF